MLFSSCQKNCFLKLSQLVFKLKILTVVTKLVFTFLPICVCWEYWNISCETLHHCYIFYPPLGNSFSLTYLPSPFLLVLILPVLPPPPSLHCKKRLLIFSSPAGMSPTYLSWPGIIKLFPASGSLVSDIPSGDGKISNLFLQCIPPSFSNLPIGI